MNNFINRRNAIKKTALLMGYAVSVSAISGIFSGCKADPKAIAGGLENWTPAFLSKSEGQLIAQIAESILPKTDTPGAIDAGVYSFIDIILKDNTETEDQIFFKNGLSDFVTSCQEAFGKSFLECDKKEKIEVLKNEEALAIEKRNANSNEKTFWFTMKELTLLGFFTSELGSKQFLKYDEIPGNYDACIPLDDVGGCWHSL